MSVSYNVGPAALLVWTAPPSASRNTGVNLANLGQVPVFYGQSGVTPFTGQPLAPGADVFLNGATVNLYVCAAVPSPVAQSTVSSANMTRGTSVITVAASNPSYFTNGTYVQVGNGTSVEFLEVNSVGTTGLTVFTYGVSVYDHLSGSSVQTFTVAPATVTVRGTGF